MRRRRRISSIQGARGSFRCKCHTQGCRWTCLATAISMCTALVMVLASCNPESSRLSTAVPWERRAWD